MKHKLKEFAKDFKETSPEEFWVEGVLYNFIYGFLGATMIVAVAIRVDLAVLVAYLLYYFFLGKVVNRPKYVTDLGKFIVFPVPTALGAFIGYKLAPYFISLVG